MIALPPVQLDGSPLDGSTVNATLAEAAQSGALVGLLTGGASYTLLDDAGGLFFLDGDQLRRSESGVLSDVDQPSVTLTLQVDDGAGNISTVTAVIAVSASASHDLVSGSADNDALFSVTGSDFILPGAGNDTIEAGSSDVIILSGTRDDYEIVVTEGNDGYGGYGSGGATDTTITLRDLRDGSPDGEDLIVTPSGVQFRFADGDYSLSEARDNVVTGLAVDGRVLSIAKHLSEDLPAGSDIGQVTIRGAGHEVPVITSIEILGFSEGQIFPTTLTGDRAAFEITSSGMLRSLVALDFESFSSYALRVVYQDAAGNTGFDILNLQVRDLDEAPEMVSGPGLNQAFKLTNFTDTTTDVRLGTLGALDPDGSTGTVSFLLGGADADKFFVADGVLFLKAGTVLDTGSPFDFDLTVTPVDSSQPAGASATVDLDIGVRVPSPLEAIRWDFTAPSDIKVYLAPGGVTVTEDLAFFADVSAPYTSVGWSAGQVALIEAVFGFFASVADLTFTFVTSLADADFAMLAAPDSFDGSAAYWATGGGTLTAGSETATLDGWGHFGMDNFTTSGFEPGSFGFYALIHEIAHGLGMAHPHDTGGGSVIMEGVTADFDSYGAFDLNQGIYTIMSYNRGWETGPNGGATLVSGNTASLGTLDIALLQAVYGANTTTHTGDDTYVLTDVSDGYSAIWDAGGRDKIVYAGTADVVISLQEATLDYSATGGGVVSYVEGVQDGFTIAHGVIIEDARGGRGNDDITGNGANNVLAGGRGVDTLRGGAGDDALAGGAGADVIDGGTGIDRVTYAASTSGVQVNLASGATSGGDAAGDVLSGIERVIGSAHADALTGDAGDNLLSGGDGNDTMSGSAGDDRLLGGAGEDVFAFDLGSGSDRVLDFAAGDRIGLTTALWDSIGATDFADFLADHARQAGSRVIIDFTATDVLRVEGVTLASLLPDSFVIF
ncbi:M10 family metallopeptidase C-terminal domain-containing protein [Stagnihabitans tardus]|uniref:Cadherin domain-containing protein n=1 Tax=Stagnihabitans tardus TaxID=2699202 RepID=A0AAE5BTR6_9RHOB|nr:M10 family metallopeptidase C-terminal domain-containing protein [Stagnihabitans tardus]NBZ86482.1 hypothetical protein [Stagnihabitans tardus]